MCNTFDWKYFFQILVFKPYYYYYYYYLNVIDTMMKLWNLPQETIDFHFILYSKPFYRITVMPLDKASPWWRWGAYHFEGEVSKQ